MNHRSGTVPILVAIAALLVVVGAGYLVLRHTKDLRQPDAQPVIDAMAPAHPSTTIVQRANDPPAQNPASKDLYALPAGPKSKLVDDGAGGTYLGSSAYYVTFHGFDSVTFADEQGNVDNDVPGTTVNTLEPGGVSVITGADATYTYTIDPKDTGSHFTVVYGFDNADQALMAVRYRDFALPSGVKARFQTTPTGVTLLRSDEGARGTFVVPATPTAVAYGAAALDDAGPVVSIAGKRQAGDVVTITIIATDPAGVKGIRYSTDGSLFPAYAGPFTVDRTKVKTITAFADDFVGNRGVPVQYQVAAAQ